VAAPKLGAQIELRESRQGKLVVGISRLRRYGAAQTAAPTAPLSGVVMVGGTLLIGADLNRDQVPAATQVLSASDVNCTGIPDITETILPNVRSATN
jgi:hypothetical protein